MVMNVSGIAVWSELALVKVYQTLYNTGGVAGPYTVAEEWHNIAEYIHISVICRVNWCYSTVLKIQGCYAMEASSVAFTGSDAVCIPRQDNGMHSVALASVSGLPKKNKKIPWIKKKLTVFVSHGNELQAYLPSASSVLQGEILYNSVQKEYIVYQLWCFQ